MIPKHCLLGLFICELFTLARQSIVGVTYRDKFDFEERNRHDVCNPLYWHPLHMPDHCTAMYEKLIRSKLYNTHPYEFKNMQNDEKNINKLKRILKIKTRRRQQSSSESTDCSSEEEFYSEQTVESTNDHYFKYENPNVNGAPYQRMLDEMREDVIALPAMPVVGFMPNIGLAAIYSQPVSKKTKKTIKKTAAVYASAARDSYAKTADLFSNFYLNLLPPIDGYKNGSNHSNKNDQNNKTIEINKDMGNKLQLDISKEAENKFQLELNKMTQPFLNHNLNNNYGQEGKNQLQFEINKVIQPFKQNLLRKGKNEKDDKNNSVKKIDNGDTVTYIKKSGYFID
ncbi:hypothetical protein NE865_06423 [Phthorimaea operculella]|nr:hypothetical protein NE865_06423 [Phthorimaea operculella]